MIYPYSSNIQQKFHNPGERLYTNWLKKNFRDYVSFW